MTKRKVNGVVVKVGRKSRQIGLRKKLRAREKEEVALFSNATRMLEVKCQ